MYCNNINKYSVNDLSLNLNIGNVIFITEPFIIKEITLKRIFIKFNYFVIMDKSLI